MGISKTKWYKKPRASKWTLQIGPLGKPIKAEIIGRTTWTYPKPKRKKKIGGLIDRTGWR